MVNRRTKERNELVTVGCHRFCAFFSAIAAVFAHHLFQRLIPFISKDPDGKVDAQKLMEMADLR
jgi:hypothetical protein